MLITREVDYGVRIVRNLNTTEFRNIVDIAKKEKMTETIAHKIARTLQRKGLIQSRRGISGGYALAKSLDELTLYDVYVAIVEKPAINECLLEGSECPINNAQGCGVHRELRRIQDVLFEELKKTPISHMLSSQ